MPVKKKYGSQSRTVRVKGAYVPPTTYKRNGKTIHRKGYYRKSYTRHTVKRTGRHSTDNTISKSKGRKNDKSYIIKPMRGYSVNDYVKLKPQFDRGRIRKIIKKKKIAGETMYLLQTPTGFTYYADRDMLEGKVIKR